MLKMEGNSRKSCSYIFPHLFIVFLFLDRAMLTLNFVCHEKRFKISLLNLCVKSLYDFQK